MVAIGSRYAGRVRPSAAVTRLDSRALSPPTVKVAACCLTGVSGSRDRVVTHQRFVQVRPIGSGLFSCPPTPVCSERPGATRPNAHPSAGHLDRLFLCPRGVMTPQLHRCGSRQRCWHPIDGRSRWSSSESPHSSRRWHFCFAQSCSFSPCFRTARIVAPFVSRGRSISAGRGSRNAKSPMGKENSAQNQASGGECVDHRACGW